MEGIIKKTVRTFALLVALCATGGAWADTLRVLGSDATICSSATTLNQLGIDMSEGKVAGKINFYTPAGCSAGDTLLFTKVEMLESTGNTANQKQEATTITITVGGQNYTSDVVVKSSVAPSSLGNLTTAGIASCKLLTYNFSNKGVFVEAGEQYDVTFNGTGLSQLRCRMENTGSGTVFTSPTSGDWKPYGVITVAPVKSSSPDVGDTILLSNTATSGAADTSATKKDFFSLTIPTDLGLPNGSVIKVTNVDLAGRNNSYSHTEDPYGIYVNGVRSLNLKGDSTYSSAPAAFDLTGAKIWVNETTCVPRLSYVFEDNCELTVGTTYSAPSNNKSVYSASGYGLTLLYANGNAIISSGNEVAAVRHVSASSGVIVNANTTSSGYYPVYEMYAEVISIPTITNTISVAGTYTLADLFTTVYDNRRYVIVVNESATLNLDASVSVKSIGFEVAAGKTLTVSGDYTITAADGIYVSGGTVAVSKKDTLSGAFRGDGTVEFTGVYGTTLNLTDKGVTDASAWQGTLAFKSVSSKSGWQFSQLGNANSTVRFDGVTDGYFNATESFGGTVDIASGGLKLHYANSQRVTTIAKLTGSGNFTIDGGSSSGAGVVFQDASGYTGAVTLGSGCNQQVTFGSSGTYGTSAKIIIASDASVTPGATWAAAGGIEVNGTLTLNSTIGMPAVAGGTGTIVCNQKVPNNDGLTASTWKGTLKINGDVGANANTKIGNTASTLEIATGSVTLTAVTSLPGRTVIDSGATLNIANTGVTEFTLGAVENSGTLDLSGCTSLETINFNLGKNRTVDLGLYGTTFKVPASLESVGTVSLVEMPSEGGTIQINSALLPFFGPTYSITYADGTALTPISTSVSGSVTSITYTPHISGAATVFDISYTNSFAIGYNAISASSGHDGWWTSPAQNPTYNNEANDTTTGMHIKWHPYISGTGSKISEFQDHLTLVAVGTMSPTANRIFLHLGSSASTNKGILILTGEKKDEVYIAYNSGTTITLITTTPMTVPNAATSRHSYIVTKEDTADTTTFTVYLDGIKWKTTTFPVVTLGSSTEIQVGSDISGNIKNSTSGTYKAVDINADTATETGVINTIRLYDRIITPAEIAEYAAVYPYVSPNGSSSRTFAAAAENWIDTTESSTVWDNSSEDDSGTPTEDASVTVTASADTTITVNLESVTEYESLTINGSSVKFTPASASSGAIKVTGMTVVGTAVTNVYGAVDMTGGPMTITEDGDITFNYSAYDISDIYTTTDIDLTSAVDEDSTRVHLIAPSAEYRTVSLVYTDGHYAMRITPDHEAGSDVYYAGGYWGTTENTFAVTNASGTASVIFPGDVVVIPAYHGGTSAYFGATLPANVTAIRVEKDFTFESGVDNTAILGGATVTVADGCTLSFATSWHNLTLGAVTFNGPGGVTIPSLSSEASITGAVSGSATLTVSGTVTVPSTGSIANTVVGNGRIVFEGALPTSNLKTSFQNSSTWTGTVELKNYTHPSNSDYGIIKFNDYGTSSSAIALNGVTSLIFTGNDDYPNVTLRELEIGEGGWTDAGGAYTIDPTYTAQLTGHGTITIKTGGSEAKTVKFIGNHTFDGSVIMDSGTLKQVAFMKTAREISSVTAKAIVVAGLDMSIASGKTWTAPGGIKIDGTLTVLTSQKATATSGTISAYKDGDGIGSTDDEATGKTIYASVTPIAISDNQASQGDITVIGAQSITGTGGAYMSSLTIKDGATLTYDPVITPLRVEAAPVFNGTGKLKLASRYAGVTCGKFHLVSYPSESFNGYSEEALKALVDSSSFNNATYTVSEVKVSLTGKQEDLSVASTDLWQLVLKVGDYDNDAKDVSIAQFGDSITEGIWRNGDYTSDGIAYRGTPNYRIPLMQLLEAYGYRPEARGYREIGSMDANGVLADDNYKWHTGISAQRIYTGGSIRAGFMESIEAHLEQVGVTDIITLKIGTNDAIGGESADNMFEGWSNLVWKIVRMRPTSKIVVCAPINIHTGGENNAPGLRQKIAEYVNKTPDQGGFPANQVTLINGSPDGSNNYSGTEIIPADDNYYMIGSVKTDRIHPNWNGHLRLANAWLPAVTNAIESMNGTRAAAAYTAQTLASASALDELADYRAGYVKLATFTNFNAKLSTWSESPYVSVNEAYTNVPMRRVAYFVARKTKASPDTRYVWVDMDADSTTGTTLADFGVPTSASVNGVVNNLHIYSNSSAIENVAPTVSGVRGTLMRTEKGVNTADGISTTLAPTGPYGFDWNDSINGSGAWGVMNMARIFDGVTPTTHRKLLAAQILFDFNGFNGGRQNALGLGNFAVHGPYLYGNGAVENYNLNWSFTTKTDEMPTMDARALDTGVIEIWGKPAWGTIFSVY